MEDGKYILSEDGITDKCTGEIIDYDKLDRAISIIDTLDEGGTLYSKTQVDKHKEITIRNESQREVIEYFGNFLFLKVKNEMVSFAEKQIPEQYIPRIFMMSTFANNDGLIVKDGTPMIQKDLIKMLNIAKSTFIRMTKELEGKKILKKVDGKYYKLSKAYFVRGQLPKVQNKTRYIKVFINTIREIYSSLNISKISHYKAFVMAIHLLPFLEKDTCIPKHPNGDNVTVRELLQMVGVNDDKYWKQINYVKHLKLNNGEQLVRFVTSGFNKENALNASMVINPKVFYSGDSEIMIDVDSHFVSIPNN